MVYIEFLLFEAEISEGTRKKEADKEGEREAKRTRGKLSHLRDGQDL
jgi:hypothetical protein